MLVVVLVAFWMTAPPLTSVFSIAFLPAVVAPVLLLMLMMLLALLVLLAGAVAVDLCWATQRVCLSCWTAHLDFYYAFVLTLEVVEAVVVVDYFRCCCLVLVVLVVVAANLPVRQKLQERLDRLDPDPHYYCLPAPFSPSTLTLPSLAGA